MKRYEFIVLCEHYGIAPAIALENEKVRAALKARDDAEVERLLREEF